MKKEHLMMVILLLAGVCFKSYAQVPGLPNPSPTQTITQELGLGKVSVTYSRPSVKGRKIFGSLVPYGKVWRTGANTATEITFSEDIKLEGHPIPAGIYSLFTIPGKEEWTIILSKAVKDWGAYSYDQKNDLLRFTVKSGKLTENRESFAILFENTSGSLADLRLEWNHTQVSLHLQADDDEKITANIEKLMQDEHPGNLVYFNAIQYYYATHKDIDKALGWLARAKKDVPTNPAFYLFESRFLLRKGDRTAAIAAAQGGLNLAKSLKFEEYIKLNEEALDLAKK